jgi:hypothetical protein
MGDKLREEMEGVRRMKSCNNAMIFYDILDLKKTFFSAVKCTHSFTSCLLTHFQKLKVPYQK